MVEPDSVLQGVPLALALANTIDLLEDPPDLLRDVGRLRRFLDRWGYESQPGTGRDLARIRELRDRIIGAMGSDPATAATVLGRLGARLDTGLRLVPADPGTWTLRHGPAPEEGLDALSASVVVGLMELLAAGEWDRIGTCAGAPCRCYFVDRTRNRTRRFCCQLCADRVNQARARARRRAGAGAT
jgi:predicted RNA-binding Zn ribbon-like protein